MAMSATKVLFPESALVGATTKFSGPIALASLAMDAYKKVYENEMKRTNALMQSNYKELSDTFHGILNDTASNLGWSEYGKAAYNAIRAIAAQRAKHFEAGTELESFCQNVVRHKDFGIIADDKPTIRKRTEEGYGELCKRIYNTSQGSHLKAWADMLIRLDPSQPVEYINIFSLQRPKPKVARYNPICKCNVTKGSKRHLVSFHAGGKVADKALNSLLANIWRLEVHHIDNWVSDDVTYVWPINDPPKIDAIAANYAKGNIGDIVSRLQQADKAVAQQFGLKA